MHSLRKVVVSVWMATFATGCASPGLVDEKSAEKEIWGLEQTYWENNRAANYDAIVSTWDDRFLGWPDSRARPVDKEEGARYVRQEFQEPASYSFEIEPAGIRVLGNVAVNYYRVRLKEKDSAGAEQVRSMRVIHTWIREDGRWKVLGGMSKRE